MCKGIPPHHSSNIDTAQYFTFYYYFYLIETNRNWTVFYWAKKKIPIGSKIWGDSLLEFVFLMAQRHQGKLRWISKSNSEINTQLCGPTQGRCVRLPDRPLRGFLLPHPNCSSVWIDTKKASAESLSDGYTEKPSSTFDKHTQAHHSTHSPCLIDRAVVSAKLTSKAVDRTAPPQGSKEDDKRRQGGEVEEVKLS